MRKLLIGAVATTVAALLLVPTALAAPDEINTERLRNGVTTSGILNHMRALQRAANANEGNRAANTTGYDASWTTSSGAWRLPATRSRATSSPSRTST